VTDDLRTAIAEATAQHGLDLDERDADGNNPCTCGEWVENWDEHWADIALAAIQDRYVPPPPGSDRDKLPDHVLAAIGPHLRPYLSTACETAQACHIAAARDLDLHDELRGWEQREHSACRLRRKQDVADCGCRCHREATP
jgi:hypothetical protein